MRRLSQMTAEGDAVERKKEKEKALPLVIKSLLGSLL